MVNDGKWTPEIIGRFWDYIGTQPHQQDFCFSKELGEGIMSFLTESESLHEQMTVLDFGCGPGFLLHHLLSQGLVCYGVDSSEEQVALVNKKFSDLPSWKGASVAFEPPLFFAGGSFDLVVCLEVLEHLTADLQDVIPCEILRLLKPQGRALFTTPNSEDLAMRTVYCPFCDTKFHRRQHLRSLDSGGMRSMLESFGFRVLFCESLDLSGLQRPVRRITWKDWSPRLIAKRTRLLSRSIIDSLRPKPFPNSRAFRARAKCRPGAPHLCALVEKP